MVQQVKKGDPITAQAWNEMAAAINNNLAARGGAIPPRPIPVTIKNRTEFTVQAGGTLTVYKGGTQRISSLSPDNARKAWQNNGFQLDGYSSGTGGVPALVLDSIPEGGIGRAMVSGLCAGYVTVSGSVPDTVRFNPASATFAAAGSGETADWKIIAASSVSSGKAFCYMIPLGGGGGNYPTDQAVTNISNKYYQTALSWSQAGHDGKVVISESTYTLNAANEDQAGISFVSDVYCDEYGVMHIEKMKLQLSKTNGSTAVLTLSKSVLNAQPSGTTLPICDLNLTKKTFLKPEN